MAGLVGVDVAVPDTQHGSTGTAAVKEHRRGADTANVPVLVGGLGPTTTTRGGAPDHRWPGDPPVRGRA